MGKLLAAVAATFMVLVGYVLVFGKPNTQPAQVDPQKVVDAGGQAAQVVEDVGEPWYLWLVGQPWFYGALAAGVTAFFVRRWWLGLDPAAKIITAVGGTALFMVVAIGVAK